MSNHLAIAHVTATIRQILSNGVDTIVSSARVTVGRLDVEPSINGPGPPPKGINIFLYEAVPNAAYRNNDLPTRSPDGGRTLDRPTAALDLHYLLSFFGLDNDFEPQRLLGFAARRLHAHASLASADIRDAAAAYPDILDPQPDAANPNPIRSNLEEQTDRVRITPLSLSLEEMSKLWSVFVQKPYRLSVAYRASVVLLEEDIPTAPVFPVGEVRPWTRPNLNRIPPPQTEVPSLLTTVQFAGNPPVPSTAFALVTPIPVGSEITVGLVDIQLAVPPISRKRTVYDVPLQEIRFQTPPTPVPQGVWYLPIPPETPGEYYVIARVLEKVVPIVRIL